jgi:hypothetical protein
MLVDEILVVGIDRNLMAEKDISIFLQGLYYTEELSLSVVVYLVCASFSFRL